MFDLKKNYVETIVKIDYHSNVEIFQELCE